MAYYRDFQNQPRSVRELVTRVSRSRHLAGPSRIPVTASSMAASSMAASSMATSSIASATNRIPRSNVTCGIPSLSVTTNQSATPTCSNVEEEMGCRFRRRRCRPVPMADVEARSCRDRVVSETAMRSRSSTRYTPYSIGHYRNSNSKLHAGPTGRSFTRTIFLLHPHEDVIPRGTQRQIMYEEGRVVDFVELHTSWNENRIRNTISDVFESVLPNTTTPR